MNKSKIQKISNRAFKILCLDGGGIKGIFSAAFLAAVEEDLKLKVADYFDLIAGTSTGGIIALALGLGKSPREIVDFYVQDGKDIFSDPIGFRKAKHWFRHKYSEQPLMAALKKCYGDKKFGHSKKRLVIPSFNLGESDVYLFRTAHHERLRRDYKVPAWKVALATTAAPTYFPVCQEVDQLRLVDGGVWANNPAMASLVESYGTLKIPLQLTYMLSIGTSEETPKKKGHLNKGGKIAWSSTAVDLVIQAQSVAANNQATFLLGKEKVVRVNPKVCEGEFALDGIQSTDDLIAKARHYSRVYMPFLGMYFSKKAKLFNPIHKL